MTITFRPAKRESVGLWINLIGGTGGGKTFTGMRLASGICGDRPFAVIDTENRRALHYADQFKFHHAELHPPFRPDTYAEAIVAADKAGYPVIMVDSGSHVWAGDGGMLDWQEEELNRMAGDDYGKRERVKVTSWIKPKSGHKKMVQKLLQVKAHIILCLRAEEKIEMVKVNGKMEVRAKQSMTGKDGWIPICDKNLPFEATCSFLLLASNPGIPHPIKLQQQHREIFPLEQPIDERAGQRLAEWAKGSGAEETKREQGALTPPAAHAPGAGSDVVVTRTETLTGLCVAAGVTLADMLARAEVKHADELSEADYEALKASLAKRIDKRRIAA